MSQSLSRADDSHLLSSSAADATTPSSTSEALSAAIHVHPCLSPILVFLSRLEPVSVWNAPDPRVAEKTNPIGDAADTNRTESRGPDSFGTASPLLETIIIIIK